MPSLVRLVLLISLPLFILDFVTKEWTVRTFPAPEADVTPRITVIPDYFDFVRVHNTGVAFGMGNGGAYSNYIFGAISLTALGSLCWMYKKGAFPTRLSQVAVALLISGVLGNLLDRFLRGYVVDFLHVHAVIGGEDRSWPAFNVADSCICVAAAFLFLSAFQKQPVATNPVTPAS
jgi:signal peptidase II